ncbi:MAG: chromosome segregation protein SMC, partial [Nitrosomonas sp.]|nr:chromosome segregation protein SMC [Nitrosomonas sp.]
IEQGMISRIIEAKPQELKTFLEEAAGISKYRERRHETELRLNDTRKNLLRLQDISNELKKQIDHLKDQAAVATEFNTLTKKLQETQQILWLQRKIEASKQRLATEEEITLLAQELEAEIRQRQLNKTQREHARVHEQSLGEKLHDLQGQLYGANAEKARINQEITQFNKQKEQLAYQIQDLDKQLTRNQHQFDTATDNLQHWHAEKKNALIAHKQGLLKNELENAKLPEYESLFNQSQNAFDTAQQNLILTEQACNLSKTHIQHANKTLEQFESRKERLQQEYDSLNEPNHKRLSEIQIELEKIENQLDRAKKILLQAEAEFKQESYRKDSAVKQVHELQRQLSHFQAQFNALQNLQQKIENNDALNDWLIKHELESIPRLWRSIKIEKDWEQALESILQERLNSIGLPQLEIFNNWKNDLPPGKLSIFEFQNPDNKVNANNQLKPNNRTHWKTLASFLSCANICISSVLSNWLRNIYVVDSIQIGLQQRHQLTLEEILVTREGHTLTRNTINFHSPDSYLHGVLSRQRELDQIQAEIKLYEKKLKKQKSVLEKTTANHEQLVQIIQLSRTDQQQLTQHYHHLQLEKTKLSQMNDQIEQRRNLIMTELAEINGHLVSERQQKENAEAQLRNHLDQIEKFKKFVEAAKTQLAAARLQLADQQLTVQNSNKEIQESIFNKKICHNKINDIEISINVLEEQKKQLLTRRDNLLSTHKNLDDAVLRSQLDDCILQCRHLEQKVTDNRDHLEKARHQIQTIENQSMVSEQKQTSLRESLNQLHLKKQESSLLETRYEEQLSETQAQEISLMPLVNQKSFTALETEINRTHKKIAAMGPVNLAALDELESSRQREASLDTQIKDLNEAIAILESAIEQIDRETQSRLQKTFNAVNHNLNEIFPIIFSGGKAELVLSNGKILESGIMLTAQPPGKKNNSIHLLSGGEKALTALALIFALFRLKPAPFCLLDEVDAPLDDNNTIRFCELVKKLSQQVQFMFISHNKITMEIAQQLIGITMQEQGISRVVSVDIANVGSPGDKTETVLS